MRISRVAPNAFVLRLLLTLVSSAPLYAAAEASARPSIGSLQAQVSQLQDEVAGQALLRTIVVHPAGPTAADNCDALLAALASISDDSATNPYLVKLEPGVYDCGANGHVVLKPYVDLEGSGEGVTLVQGEGRTYPGIPAPGGGTYDNALLVGASHSQVRSLTLALTQAYSTVTSAGATSFSMLHVTVRSAVGGTGILGSVDLTDVTVDMEGGCETALLLDDSTLTNVTATAKLVGTACGTVQALASGGTVSARNSSFSAIGGGRVLFVGGPLNLVASQVVGSIVVSTGGALSCIAVYDANFNPLTCP